MRNPEFFAKKNDNEDNDYGFQKDPSLEQMVKYVRSNCGKKGAVRFPVPKEDLPKYLKTYVTVGTMTLLLPQLILSVLQGITQLNYRMKAIVRESSHCSLNVLCKKKHKDKLKRKSSEQSSTSSKKKKKNKE